MPIYEYRCENGHTFEVMQSMSDDPLAECEVCGAPVQKVLHAPAVHFKGSGFYTTDYGKGKKAAGANSGEAKKDKETAGSNGSGPSESSSSSDSSKSGDGKAAEKSASAKSGSSS